MWLDIVSPSPRAPNITSVASMDASFASKNNLGHQKISSKADRPKRAGKVRRWFCRVVPTVDGSAKSSGGRNDPSGLFDGQGSKQKKQKQKQEKKKSRCFEGCCSNGCWCSCNVGKKKTKKKQLGAAEHRTGRDAENVYDGLPQTSNRAVESVVEMLTPRRRRGADNVLDLLSPRRSKDANKNMEPPASRRESAIVGGRLPPGPAREFPVPNPVVGQEVCLKTALSYLADDAVDIVGIYGVGGVGKTTLLRSINNQFCGSAARTEFDHVVLVVVGKDPDVKKLQRDIAYEVGLLLRDDDTEAARAAAISNFFKTKNFLLLLDDLWGPLDLAEVGIPQPATDGTCNRKQKLIISTRLVDVAGKMQAHKILILECLKWEEAWSLFASKVGEDTVQDRKIRSIAVALSKECGGLPLALVTMGSVMSSKRTPEEWQQAMSLLKNAPLRDISGMEDEPLSLLHVSYENMKDHRMRECFSFCSLWPEGYQMLKENLIRSWMGLGSIDNFDDITEAFSVGYSIIESLKATSLLETGEKGYRRLAMHDVIRDMVLWNASEEGSSKKWFVGANTGQTRSEEWSGTERISLMFNDIETLPDSCYCPNLQSLILRGNKRLLKIPSGIFPCMLMLRYLDLSHTGILQLPQEVGTLVNLQFLNLSFTKITSLPEETRNLTNLKYLELEGTTELRKIPHGVISSLEMLLVLNLYMSGFANWNWLLVHGHDGINFEELVSLPRLRSVGFTVRNIPSLLKLFSIQGVSTHSLTIRELRGLISLHLLPALLSKNKMGRLVNLTIESSQVLKELVMGEENTDSPNWRFYQLEVFNLVCLPELERVIWKGVTPHVCFQNLRVLSLFYCNRLKNITWTSHLPLLEELYIQKCNEMERLIDHQSTRILNADEVRASFPNLKYIYLHDLKKLVRIIDQVLAFSCLERILVYHCSELKQLPLGVRSAEKLRMIFGERCWWESLEWEDQNVKSIFTTCFREIPARYEPSMKILDGL